jgi:hypothetical protein
MSLTQRFHPPKLCRNCSVIGGEALQNRPSATRAGGIWDRRATVAPRGGRGTCRVEEGDVAMSAREAAAGPGERPAAEAGAPEANRPAVVTLIGLLLLVLSSALVAAVIAVWPAVQPPVQPPRGGAASPTHVGLLFGLLDLELTRDTALFVLVVVVSALGSFIHAATSFADYVGNRRLVGSWTWWYLMRASIGMALGLLFYFAVRGGFFSSSSSSNDVNPYGMAALAGLAGLFAKQATDKLREVFETMFRVAPHRGDAERGDELANPRPHVDELLPARVTAGASSLRLEIAGRGFVDASVVRVNGEEQPTRVLSGERLEVSVPARFMETECANEVTVVNPKPGGGMSDAAMLTVFVAESVVGEVE